MYDALEVSPVSLRTMWVVAGVLLEPGLPGTFEFVVFLPGPTALLIMLGLVIQFCIFGPISGQFLFKFDKRPILPFTMQVWHRAVVWSVIVSLCIITFYDIVHCTMHQQYQKCLRMAFFAEGKDWQMGDLYKNLFAPFFLYTAIANDFMRPDDTRDLFKKRLSEISMSTLHTGGEQTGGSDKTIERESFWMVWPADEDLLLPDAHRAQFAQSGSYKATERESFWMVWPVDEDLLLPDAHRAQFAQSSADTGAQFTQSSVYTRSQLHIQLEFCTTTSTSALAIAMALRWRLAALHMFISYSLQGSEQFVGKASGEPPKEPIGPVSVALQSIANELPKAPTTGINEEVMPGMPWEFDPGCQPRPGATETGYTSTSLTFTGSAMTTLGNYRLCWCTEGSECASASDFTVGVGQLTLGGPLTSQVFNVVINHADSLTVVGNLLGSTNRVLITSTGKTCGAASQSPNVIDSAPGAPAASSSALTFSGVEVNAKGGYKVCWWSGTGGTPNYDTDVGTLNVGGPDPSQSFTVVMRTDVSLTVVGDSMTISNRLKLIAASEICGVDDQAVGVLDGRITADVQAGHTVFAGFQMKALGAYKVCWWHGVGVDSAAAYDTEVGAMLVKGPPSSQTLAAVVNAAFSPTVVGTGLSCTNRIKIILANQTCGSHDESAAYVDRLSAILPTGSDTALTFASCRVKAVGSYRICWWSGLGTETVRSYSADVALLTVSSPSTLQYFGGLARTVAVSERRTVLGVAVDWASGEQMKVTALLLTTVFAVIKSHILDSLNSVSFLATLFIVVAIAMSVSGVTIRVVKTAAARIVTYEHPSPAPGADAEPALVLGLRPGWEPYLFGTTGEFYYYHAESGKSQWERPSVNCDSSSSTTVFDDVPSPCRARYAFGNPGVNVASGSGYNTPPQSPCPSTTVATTATPPTTVESPCLATIQTGRLPPGWLELSTSGHSYYADLETQSAQWTRPADYVERNWWRAVDPQGVAYWECRELHLSFYEHDTSWTRFVDGQGRIYWSNPWRNTRFFEPLQYNGV